MSNMDYCRFENTAHDLNDCWVNWNANVLPVSELRGKRSILRAIASILDECGIEFDADDYHAALDEISAAIESARE